MLDDRWPRKNIEMFIIWWRKSHEEEAVKFLEETMIVKNLVEREYYNRTKFIVIGDL